MSDRLIHLRHPVEVHGHQAWRLLELAAQHLWGPPPDSGGWLRRVELPADPPRAATGARHPRTSQQAGDAHGPKAGSNNRRVLAHLVKLRNAHTASGATAAELADLFGWTRPYTATRLWELRRGGWIECHCDEYGPMTRSTGPGREGMVQRAAAKAVALYQIEGTGNGGTD